jgi:hypothetical protein
MGMEIGLVLPEERNVLGRSALEEGQSISVWVILAGSRSKNFSSYLTCPYVSDVAKTKLLLSSDHAQSGENRGLTSPPPPRPLLNQPAFVAGQPYVSARAVFVGRGRAFVIRSLIDRSAHWQIGASFRAAPQPVG